jgi:hypothetical protein
VLANVSSAIQALYVDSTGDLRACGRMTGWRVPARGGIPVADRPHTCTIPSPTTASVVKLGSDNIATVIASADAIDDPSAAAATIAEQQIDTLRWMPDGGALLYVAHGGVLHRLDVASHEDVVVRGISAHDSGDLAVSPDGSTLYIPRHEGVTTRHIMTNYGDRPRRR